MSVKRVDKREPLLRLVGDHILYSNIIRGDVLMGGGFLTAVGVYLLVQDLRERCSEDDWGVEKSARAHHVAGGPPHYITTFNNTKGS